MGNHNLLRLLLLLVLKHVTETAEKLDKIQQQKGQKDIKQSLNISIPNLKQANGNLHLTIPNL